MFNNNAYQKISAELDSLNIKYCHVEAAIFSLHKEELRNAIETLDDERSRDIYFTLLQDRSNGGFYSPEIASWDHMFVNPAFQFHNYDDVFIDCGAFVGDTIEKFLDIHGGILKSIIGFEPDEKNFAALEKRVKRLRDEWNFNSENLAVFPYALADKSSVSYIRRHEDMGPNSSIVDKADDKTKEIKAVAIDDFCTEKFTMLKADIESYEYKMLLGAEKSIKKYKPRLAICIYHNASDFYSIPLLVKKFCPDYKITIRHHSVQTAETVLYAW